MPQPLSERTASFTDSVIRRMTRVSLKYGAVNLSQGFPDFEPPQAILERLAQVAREGPHQYSVTWGAQNFREALARKQSRYMGRTIDPDKEIVATCGSTEAMMCAMMTVTNPGDKVIVFSPFYENYGADTILSGAEPIYVPLHPPAFTFDVDELEMKTAEDGKRVLVRPRVVDAGYANRKLLRLTGLDVQENQARRLLNDLDAYRTSTWRDGEDLEIVATDWMREVFEPTVRMIPREYRSQIEPAQFFHEVLDHRWFLAEKAGHDVSMTEAVKSYVENVLPQYKLDSKDVDALNAEADSGVIDDEYTYGTDEDGYNPDDDPDAAVWSH